MADSPLYLARMRAGLKQSEAARLWCERWPEDARERKAWTAWESGAREPSLHVLRRLAAIYGCTLAELAGEPEPEHPAPLTVAVAIVTRDDEVLLVQRRDDLRFQFPSGVVKAGREPERTAIREVEDETGVICSPTANLGTRVHPVTKAVCVYVAARYVAGEVTNHDPDENAAALWVSVSKLGEFIPTGVFGPVLEHLGAARV